MHLKVALISQLARKGLNMKHCRDVNNRLNELVEQQAPIEAKLNRSKRPPIALRNQVQQLEYAAVYLSMCHTNFSTVKKSMI